MPPEIPASPASTLRPRLALYVVSAIGLALLVFYVVAGYRASFNSDSAIKNILAREILDSGSLFPPTFRYVRSLWLIHGHLPLLLLIPWLGNGFAAHAAAGLLFIALFLAAVWGFLGHLALSPSARLLTTLTVASGLSPQWAEHMFGQASYGWYCLILLVSLWAASRFFLDDRPGPGPLLAAVAVSVVAGFQGSRVLVETALPVGAALVALSLMGQQRMRPARVLVWGAAFAAGSLARSAILARVSFLSFSSSLLTPDSLPRAWVSSSVISLFGLLPEQPVVASIRDAWVYPARLVFLLLFVAANLGAVALLPRGLPVRRAFLVLAHVTLTFVTAYEAFTVKDLVGIPRYLIPAMFTAILVAGLYADERGAERWGRFGVPVGVGLLLVSLTTYIPGLAAPGPNRLTPLIDVLERNGVRFGYATFWNGPAATVLSSSRVELRQVILEDGLPLPYRHLSVDRWYTRDHAGPTALVLEWPVEGARLDQARLFREAGPPERTLELEGFRVFVYPTNVFPDIAAWKAERGGR